MYFIGRLYLLEALSCLRIARIGVRMRLLHQTPVRGLDGLEVSVAVEIERAQRPHFVTAPAAVARPRPFPLRRLPEALRSRLLLCSASRRFFRRQAGE